MLSRWSLLASRRSFSAFSAEEFVNRRSALGELVRSRVKTDEDAIVLLSGARREFIAPDVPNAFRQCSHFRYLSGVTVPDCHYLISFPAKGPSRRILFMETKSAHERLWDGDGPSEGSLARTAQFDDVISPRKLLQTLARFSGDKSVLLADRDNVREPFGFASVMDIKCMVDQLRLVKSTQEVAAMENVCTIGSQMMSSMISASKECGTESAIVGLLEYEARKRGAETLAYPPVVAAGDRANIIHYLDAKNPIHSGDCMLVDAGCDLNGYVSDVTRCFPVSGEWTDSQRTLYDALLYVHEQLLVYANEVEKVKLSGLYIRMIELIASTMLEVGLIPKGTDRDQMLKMAEELCPHHVSHYLGMDVHDCVSVSRDIKLLPNVAFTIEPGVYVPLNSTYPEEFRGIGFRIEDDIITSEEGIRVLTDQCPREAREIEYIMDPQ